MEHNDSMSSSHNEILLKVNTDNLQPPKDITNSSSAYSDKYVLEDRPIMR